MKIGKYNFGTWEFKYNKVLSHFKNTWQLEYYEEESGETHLIYIKSLNDQIYDLYFSYSFIYLYRQIFGNRLDCQTAFNSLYDAKNYINNLLLKMYRLQSLI